MQLNGEIERESGALPPMLTFAQQRRGRVEEDIEGATLRALEASGGLLAIKPGQRIAITAGSRGIANLPQVLRVVCAAVRSRGAEPFLFPAMGTHGGGTAEGQTAVLAAMGITEATVGAPIVSSMAVVSLGTSSEGVPVFLDRSAAEADGLIAVNRIKSHTDYSGRYESGLVKMLAVGVGKRRGAETLHSAGVEGLRRLLLPAARVVIEKAPVLAGIAILENSFHQTAEIVGLSPAEIVQREPELLLRAKEMEARLPFEEIDLLIVDWMGKDLSGVGMDTNVIGRLAIRGEPDPPRPRIARIFVRDLSPASHGNAVGVGLADFTTQRLADAIDWESTSLNALTSGFLERVKLPLTYNSDRDAIEAALASLGKRREAARLVRIRDTLHLSRLQASESLLEQARALGLQQVGQPFRLAFDAAGNLSPGWAE